MLYLRLGDRNLLHFAVNLFFLRLIAQALQRKIGHGQRDLDRMIPIPQILTLKQRNLGPSHPARLCVSC